MVWNRTWRIYFFLHNTKSWHHNPTLPGTYTYSLRVTTTINGNSYFNTQSIEVVVDDAGTIGTTIGDQIICQNSQPTDLILTGNTGTIQWQKSTDNITFTDIVGEISNVLAGTSIGNLTETTYFQAVVTNGTCDPIPSNLITVTVEIPTITGLTTVMAGQSIQLTGDLTPHPITPWISDDDNIAIVDTSGLVTGVEAGLVPISYMTSNGCIATILITVIPSICYEDPASPGVGGIASSFGVSTLSRESSTTSNWTESRKGAFLVVESKSKGFVITRVSSTAEIVNPIEGMIVYDASSNNCLSIYDGNSWNCYNTQTCP